MRIGTGYDVHRLVPDRKMLIGGVEIPYELGLLGHSDADVLLHAISDAILGAAALGDIGKHFPDTDPNYAGADSMLMLHEVVRLVEEQGYQIGNLDCTVIAQQPKLKDLIPQMQERIAAVCKVQPNQVNVKATTEEKLGFAYPIIVKPSSSVDYWKHPFDTMKKVYTAATPAEAAEIVRTVYASGYPDRMLLQKLVPGGDDHMRVLTAFSDENGKVRAMCLGHTMVEEHTPHGLGNHAAIVSEDTTSLPLVENIRKMLEACHYTGFSNFDIKYSGIPGDYRVFEINLRQGRSNYYVTATGMNIARLVVEKWSDGGTDCVLNKNEVFWHHVPAQVAFTYTEDKDLVARAKALKAQGKEACSLLYKPDLMWNPVRYACVLEQLRRQFKKFKTYYPVQK